MTSLPFNRDAPSQQGQKVTPLNLQCDFEMDDSPQSPASPVTSPQTPVISSPRHLDDNLPVIVKDEQRRTRAGCIIQPPQQLSPSLGPGKSYASLLSLLATHLGTAKTHLAKCIQDVNMHFMDPVGLYQETMHPLTYALTRNDEDSPTYWQAMSGDDANEYRHAMATKITQLEKKGTWQIVDRFSIPDDVNVLPSTWVFKRKRLPDGTIRKYKARFCVRGDKQVEGIDFFETYAPVVAWPVVRLLLTLSIVCNLATQQVDYVNAFAQANVDDNIYIKLPKGFDSPHDGHYVLKLRKSFYGLQQSPLAWFDTLSTGLRARGFHPSEIDPCLFLASGIICIIYVDDCLFVTKEQGRIDDVIASLQTEFDLEPETDVSTFLGIKISKENTTIALT